MKKLLSVLLSVVMGISLFATTAFAGEHFTTAKLDLTVKGDNGTTKTLTVSLDDFNQSYENLVVDGGYVIVEYNDDDKSFYLIPVPDDGYYLDSFTNDGEAAAFYDNGWIKIENIGNGDQDHNQAIITMVFKAGHGYHEGDYALANSILQRSKYKDSIIHRESLTEWIVDGEYLLSWTAETPRRLTHINMYEAGLTGALDLSGATALMDVSLPSNGITSIKLPETSTLTVVWLDGTDISSIDVSKLPYLDALSVCDTEIQTIDVTKNKELVSLYTGGSLLSDIDISKNTKLINLDIANTNIDQISVSHLPELNSFTLYGTEISSIDVSKNTQLESLDVDDTKITSLDLSKNTMLGTLYCCRNNITSLDLSKNTELFNLYLNGTPVKNLDLSKNTKLYDVSLEGIDTDFVDLSGYENLECIRVTNKTKTDFFDLTPAENGTLCIEYNNSFEYFYIDATPDEGYLFDGWTGLPADLGEYSATDNYVDFALPAEKIHISGSFSVDPDYVPGGGGEEEGEGPLDHVALPPIRIKGKTRYETSMQIAEANRILTGYEMYNNIVIASGKSFPDALSGSVLAATYNAPILMASGTNDAELIQFIDEYMMEDGTVFILGGEAAVPASTEDALKAKFPVKRVKGKNRYLTSIAIIEEVGAHDFPIIVATGKDYADSLSASSLGIPILLVDGKANGLGAEQKAFLDNYNPTFIYIIGGEGAVSTGIEAELGNFADVERIKGKTRYDTSVAVAEYFYNNPRNIVFAYGHNFPDGLCGGPLANVIGAPLVLTRPEDYTKAETYVNNNDNIINAFVLGGDKLIGDIVINNIMHSTNSVVLYENFFSPVITE